MELENTRDSLDIFLRVIRAGERRPASARHGRREKTQKPRGRRQNASTKPHGQWTQKETREDGPQGGPNRSTGRARAKGEWEGRGAGREQNGRERKPPVKKAQNAKKQPPYWVTAFVCWRLPIVPGRFQPSIVGTSELNFRVRDGNGWTLTVINTNYSVRVRRDFLPSLLATSIYYHILFENASLFLKKSEIFLLLAGIHVFSGRITKRGGRFCSQRRPFCEENQNKRETAVQ